MKTMIGMVLMAAMLVMVAGCSTFEEITFDKDTGKPIAYHKASTDLAGTLKESVQNKIVFSWRSGWGGIFRVIMGTKDNPVPQVVAECFNADEGWVSIPKDVNKDIDFEKIGKAIQSTRSNIKMAADGITKGQ